MQEKRCSKCGEVKPISEFHKNKNGKYGVRADCKLCFKELIKNHYEENKEQIKEIKKKYRKENKEYYKEYRKKYYKENKENIKENIKKYREENKEYLKKKNKKYYEENKEKIIEYAKKYYEENKEYYTEYKKKWREDNRNKDNKYHNEYKKKRRKTDPEWKLKSNIQSYFWNGFRNQQVKKTNSFFKYTGIKYSEYINHLKNDPLWDDFCNGENIHIDHIIPCAVYDFTNKEHIKKCWNPDNLRLLDGIENMSKNDTLDFDLIEEYDIFHLLP